jgi:hypothetical protein
MTRLLSKLFGKTGTTRNAPTRTRTAKLTLEALDDRLVPSTASASIHAVAENSGNTAVFFINRQSHAFYESDASAGTRQLSGPGTVQTFSAGTGADGYADVFVKAGDNAFWEHTSSGGWSEILGPGNNVGSFAAVRDGGVYFLNWDNSLWYYSDAQRFHELVGPGAVQSVDAVTEAPGDAVFVIRGDNTFGMYKSNFANPYGPSWYYTPLSGAGTVRPGFSAGLDSNGYADVFVVKSDGTFWEYDSGHDSYYNVGNGWPNTGSPWRQFASAGVVKAFSAGFDGCVDVIPVSTTHGTLLQFDDDGMQETLATVGSFTEISLAGLPTFEYNGAGRTFDVYLANWDYSGWDLAGVGPYWSGAGAWHQFAAPGNVL